MRAVFGIVSLLLVLTVVGVAASRQFSARTPVVAVPGAASAAPAGSVQRQARQVQEQVREDVQKALEQATRRTTPDE